MSENQLENYTAPSLFQDIDIGDTISTALIQDLALASYSTCAIRTGAGLVRTADLDGSNRKTYFLPQHGLKGYFSRYSSSTYFYYYFNSSWTTPARVSDSSYCYFDSYAITGQAPRRVVGYLGMRVYQIVSPYFVSPCKISTQTVTVGDANQTGAEGVGPLHVIDVLTIPGNAYGVLSPMLMSSMEESADNAKFTPQILFVSSVCPYKGSTFYHIDPRLNLRHMLDTFTASAWLERSALIDGDYYVYIVYSCDDTGALTINPADTLTVASDGVTLDLTPILSGNLRVAAARIQPTSTAFSSNADYIRVSISTKVTSSFPTSFTTSFTSWADSASHTIDLGGYIMVTIFVAGRSINEQFNMDALDI